MDEVTGNVTYNQWKNANETTKFALIEIPTISGYTASRQSVEEVTPSGNDSDSEVDITYTPNEQTIQIVYKDGDKTIKTIPLTGKTNETVNVSFDIPTNYHVTNSPENTYTFKASGNQNVIVKLAHNTGSTNDTHTASRTINITNPDGKVVTTKQTATITRTGTKDLVTNQINWNNWSTASLPAYEVPTIAGYTPSQSNVNAVNITNDTQDSTVDITYTANKQSINVIYKDGDKILKTVPLIGSTGENIKVPLDVPTNYHVINSPITSYIFKPSDNSDVLVELGHNTEPTNDSHSVTRTINVTNPDGKVVTTKQMATITRTGTKDLVTNQVTWNNWSTATLPAYEVPTIAGYTPSETNIDAVHVTNDTQNSTINIIYTGNKQVINVIYKDGDKVLKTVPLSGNTGETVNVSIDIPTNYHAINSPITSYTFKPTDNSDILIELGHNTESVSDSDTVTRTINITNPDGKVVTTKQTATITRTGTRDLVTNQVNWNNWSAATLPAYEVPTIAGYTASMHNLEKIGVTGDTQDSTTNIVYTANQQSVNIVYKDGDKVLKTVPLSGNTGETVNVSIDIPTNYHVINSPITSYTFKPTDNSDILVELDHNTESVSDSDTVTRTINTTDPDGKVATIKQTATITRTGTKDLVTGMTNWNNWSTASLPSYEVPTFAGYTPSQTTVGAIRVGHNTNNSEVNVIYKANEQSVNIIYKDGDKTVKTDKISGHTGDKVDTNIQVPDGYEVNGDIPKNITFNANGHADIIVNLKHKTDIVTENKIITRTIKITTPDGQVKTILQNVKLSRQVTNDVITNEKTYSNWSTGSFDEYKVPEIAGYTASQNKVERITLDSNTQNSTINVSYTANPQFISIIYKDRDKTLKTVPLTGKTNETVNLIFNVPVNYHMINSPANTYTFKATDNTDVIIMLGHDTKNVTQKKVVNRIIKLNLPTGIKEVRQSITFKRIGVEDLVTGEVVYGKWNYDGQYQLPKYIPENIEGYTTDPKKIDALIVTPDSDDSVVEVNYEKLPQIKEKVSESKNIKMTIPIKQEETVGTIPQQKNDQAESLPQTGNNTESDVLAGFAGFLLAIGSFEISRKKRQ